MHDATANVTDLPSPVPISIKLLAKASLSSPLLKIRKIETT